MKHKKKKLLFLLGSATLIILSSFLGCTINSEQIGKIADYALDDSLNYYKAAFDKNYEKGKSKDSGNLINIKLRTDIIQLDDYINNKIEVLKSIKDEENDVANVRNIFIGKHVGDFIYYSLNEIFTLAGNSANSTAIKTYISQEQYSALGNEGTDAWTNMIFGANNTTPVTWILKGIQIEIYKIGSVVFSGKEKI